MRLRVSYPPPPRLSIGVFGGTIPPSPLSEAIRRPTCYIVGAGDFTPRGFAPVPGDLVLAADGGYRALCSLGYTPDLLLGDFDSLGDLPLPPDLPVLRFPARKDDTDTGLALRHGLDRGFRDFALYGCAGGRVDHLLANLQSMARVSRLGATIRLAAPEYDAWALTGPAPDTPAPATPAAPDALAPAAAAVLALPPRPGGTLVSVFCHGDRAEGVTLTGLAYPLSDAALAGDFPLGVSNRRLEGRPATVSVRRGTLLIFQGV